MDQELSKRERSQGSGTQVPLSDSGAGQNLAGGLGDFVPQKLKQNVKIEYNF